MEFKIKDNNGRLIDILTINTIEDLRKLSYSYKGWHGREDHADLIVCFGDTLSEKDPSITIYDDYVE